MTMAKTDLTHNSPMLALPIPLQETSLDIWDTKYRLKSKDGSPIDLQIDDITYQRVAKALAAQEQDPDSWYEPFPLGATEWCHSRLAALPRMPVRLNTNLQPRPSIAPSPETIQDSMDDILNKVHEAGLTLKAGCGIGYNFLDLAAAWSLCLGCWRLYLGSAVIHGYLRQDVFYRLLGGRSSWCPDGHYGYPSSRCARICASQA